MMKIFRVVICIIICLCITDVHAESIYTISSYDRYYTIKNDNSLWFFGTGKIKQDEKEFDPQKILSDIVSIRDGNIITKDRLMLNCIWEGNEENSFQISEKNNNVLDAGTGFSHTFIVKKDHTLWGNGCNVEGELATGERLTESSYYTPESVDSPLKIMNNVWEAYAGELHSLILKTDGSVWTWGDNTYGQLGCGKEVDMTNVPYKVMTGVKKVYSGQSSSFAIKDDGSLWRWGTNYGGMQGKDETLVEYTPVYYTDNVKCVSSKWGYNMILKNDDTLWLYGSSEDAEQVYQSFNYYIDTPIKIADDVNYISESNYYEDNQTLVLKNSGELYFFDIIPQETKNDPQYKLVKIMDDVKLTQIDFLEKAAPFNDVTEKSETIKNAVNSLARANIIEGMTDAEFAPDNPITRAETAALLLRMTAKNEASINSGFSDVTKDMWYYDVAGASKKYNIVQGFEDNTFQGDDKISNIQFVALCARTLMKEKEIEVDSSLKINTVPEWAEKEATVAVQEGLISESDTALMAPDEPITRGEATVILYELYNRV